jgi:CheY-like chemotaxis protein
VDAGLAPVKVTRATSGEQARQALEAEADTDMVLLDLDLPDTSAVSLSAWIRASLPRSPRLMALVAEDGHPDWQMLQALGVSGFALKPPAADVLLFSMRRVLADAQRERDAEAVS